MRAELQAMIEKRHTSFGEISLVQRLELLAKRTELAKVTEVMERVQKMEKAESSRRSRGRNNAPTE